MTIVGQMATMKGTSALAVIEAAKGKVVKDKGTTMRPKKQQAVKVVRRPVGRPRKAKPRKYSNRDSGDDDEPIVPPAAYTIQMFCEAFDLSLSFYYKMKKNGLGPREMHVASDVDKKGRVLISPEAIVEWRKSREQAA